MAYDGPRPIIHHVFAEDGGLVCEGAGTGGVAASFREEDGDRKVDSLRLQIRVARHSV